MDGLDNAPDLPTILPFREVDATHGVGQAAVLQVTTRDKTALGTRILALHLQPEHLHIVLVALKDPRRHLPVVHLEGVIVHIACWCASRLADEFHSGNLHQFLHEGIHRLAVGPSFVAADGIVDFHDVLRLKAQGGRDEVVRLKHHHEGTGDHHDGDHVLQDDEDLREHHLRLTAEGASHDVDRLGPRHHHGGQHTSQHTHHERQSRHQQHVLHLQQM